VAENAENIERGRGENQLSPAVQEKQEHILEELEQAVEELIDLEEYALKGHKPPRAKHYRIRIDGDKFTVDVPSMTGRQLLELAGKIPVEKFMIAEKIHGAKPRRIGLDERVEFTRHGIEKFLTQPLGQTEG
jgi:Multiubiquitin